MSPGPTAADGARSYLALGPRGPLPLLLLPGIEGDARLFARLEPLSARRTLLALDLPRAGPTLADHAAQLLVRVEAPRFFVFGQSLGGLLGRALLAAAPHRVAGLLTFGTLPRRAALPAAVARAPLWLARLPHPLFSALYRRRIARLHAEEGLPAELSAALLDNLPTRDTLLARLRALAAWGLPDRVEAPHLIVRGQVDHEAPWTLAEAQAAHPAARVHTLPGGHRAPATHPGPLISLLTEQLTAWGD